LCQPALLLCASWTSVRRGRDEGGEGMGKLKKPLLWLVVAFFAYAIFKSPTQAADIVHAAWDGILQGLRAIGDFFDALLRG
jgi:hypothetical protein